MRLIFEIIYNFLDKYIHRFRIHKFLLNLNIRFKLILDVGSHKGESIDGFLKIFHGCSVVGFEPQKDCFNFLNKKFKNARNVRVKNYALDKKKGTRKLRKNILTTTSTFSKTNPLSKHYKIKSVLLGKKKAGFLNEERVKINTLDNFTKSMKLKKIDLLKIDTEGNEMQVLIGAKKSLKKTEIILIEHNFTDYYKNYDLDKITLFLEKNFFKNIKNFKFPFMSYTDAIYVNTKLRPEIF
tara:strand:- start:3737 stop:4453 length:717 start_codon:yes stop_codon:yes gene_type:complete